MVLDSIELGGWVKGKSVELDNFIKFATVHGNGFLVHFLQRDSLIRYKILVFLWVSSLSIVHNNFKHVLTSPSFIRVLTDVDTLQRYKLQTHRIGIIDTVTVCINIEN